jgi:hypothetical protein
LGFIPLNSPQTAQLDQSTLLAIPVLRPGRPLPSAAYRQQAVWAGLVGPLFAIFFPCFYFFFFILVVFLFFLLQHVLRFQIFIKKCLDFELCPDF